MIDRNTIEEALYSGLFYARMGNGNLWKCRRNGQTQTWKTRPNAYRIPIKAGLRSTGQITENSTVRELSGPRPKDAYAEGTVYVLEG